MKRAAVVLAAGKGTRMPADTPKVMHEIQGKPMVIRVIDAIRDVFGTNIYVVVGYMADQVIAACRDQGVEFVNQRDQLGTGHAVLQCEEALRDVTGTVVVLNGDVPCLRTPTIESFLDYHDSEAAAATVLTAVLKDPTGYGRIVRGEGDALLKIVEEKDATSAEKRICEINSGMFCFDKTKLFDALKMTDRDNAQNEYYLTDVIDVLQRRGEPVRAHCVADSREVSGVNTEEELTAARRYFEGLTK